MLTGASGSRSMAAAGAGAIRGFLRRAPPVSAEQLLCNPSRPNSALTATAMAVEGGNELMFEAGEPVPRLVFGGVPSVEESKEATAELKQVLEGMYLSSPQSEISFVPGVSLPIGDIGSDVIMERNTGVAGPIHVHQALSLFAHSPRVQEVVVSLVSDPKVCKAVLINPAVTELLFPYKTSSDTSDSENEANVTEQEESGAGDMGKLRNLKDFIIEMVTSMPSHLPEFFGSSSAESASKVKDCKSGSGFVAKLRNLKDSVVEMATNIPKYFQNFYGFSAAGNVSGSDRKGNTESSLPELSLQTLTGLAIMVIMIVVFKRV